MSTHLAEENHFPSAVDTVLSMKSYRSRAKVVDWLKQQDPGLSDDEPEDELLADLGFEVDGPTN